MSSAENRTVSFCQRLSLTFVTLQSLKYDHRLLEIEKEFRQADIQV